jgi:dTDP-4-amino-4,6-dideoxygalactose transaminase
MIPFNKPFLTGLETQYIQEAVQSGKISGNGLFTKKCQAFFESKYSIKKALMTTSCTDALEMAAILADIKPGDEVIMPSFTFVSTAIAFIRQGAKIIFADSYENNPNLDVNSIEGLISKKTKAIVVVHYAGIACDMDSIRILAKKYNLLVIEDAAQGVESFYINSTGRRESLGSIGHLGAFSFHETKNIICGEGGLLSVNDERFTDRSEIIWEKGTNRSQFFRGLVNKYGWVDIGSSFLPSEIVSAFLWAQLEKINQIQSKRLALWLQYQTLLKPLEDMGFIKLISIPSYATNNAHMFFILCENLETRTELIEFLNKKNIMAVFHYLSLHKSPYYKDQYSGPELIHSDRFENTLLRLPLFYELTEEQVSYISSQIIAFYTK